MIIRGENPNCLQVNHVNYGIEKGEIHMEYFIEYFNPIDTCEPIGILTVVM